MLSRVGCAFSLRATQVRWSSSVATATKAARAPTTSSPDSNVEAGSKAEPTSSRTEAPSAPTENLRPFSDLKEIINYNTFKAITVRPFTHSHMTPVQSFVLSLLPGLSRPFGSDSQVDFKADETPSPRDLLVQAKTGTGKTLAFLVPVIEARLRAIDAYAKQAAIDAGQEKDKSFIAQAAKSFAKKNVGTLIISPTRELASQIAVEAQKLTQHHGDFEVKLFVGGESKGRQMRDYMRGSRDIVVATPGRLRDLLQTESSVSGGISKAQTLVLDEADTLLDMGFRDDLDAIINYMPDKPERQTLLFSATISPAIQQIARRYLDKDYKFIKTVSAEDSPVHAHIPQHATVLPGPEQQLPHVLRLIAHDQLANLGRSKVILFLPTTKMTQLYANILREISREALPGARNTQIYEIHSKKEQTSRTNTSNRFRQDRSGAAILVTSDVSARGVDYPGVTRVIQVGVPSSTEQYIHRIGRTGRAGTSGRGDIVLLPFEKGFLQGEFKGVPLENVTVEEIETELTTLAQKFDSDPSLSKQPEVRQSKNYRADNGPRRHPPKVAERVTAINETVDELKQHIAATDIRETFAGLLGYYLSKNTEMRCAKEDMVVACKEWAMTGMGLEEAPYVSQEFLKKMGVYADRRGSRSPGPARPGKDRNSWASRGNNRTWVRDDSMKRRSSGFESRDRDSGNGEERRPFRRSEPRSEGFRPREQRGDRFERSERTERWGEDRPMRQMRPRQAWGQRDSSSRRPERSTA